MPPLPYIDEILSIIGCLSTCLFNGFLIFLTLSHTQRITGAYKYLIILFSIFCIWFSCLEILAHPYLHNYNGGFIYFSLRDFFGLSADFRKVLIMVYAGTYASIMCLVAIQFVYRYGALIKYCFENDSISLSSVFGSEPLLTTFNNWNSIIWFFYILFFSSLFGLLCHFSAYPEPFSDGYLRDEIQRIYDLDIEDLPRSIVVAYNPDGSTRWWNLSFLFGGIFTLGFQYVLIAYCGVQMQRQMTKELKNFSVQHRKLQQQFFKALMVQITIPTILYHLPALPVLFSPLFDMELSIQSGFIFSIFSIYPPIDTVAFMWIVSEYKNAVKRIVLGQTKVSTKMVSEVSGL